MGHVLRCVALAEELRARGVEVVFLSDLGGVDLADKQLARRGFAVVDPPSTTAGLLALARRERLSAMVLDSYTLPSDASAALVADRLPVLAMVDGDLRGQVADLYVDATVGADDDPVALPPGSRRLAGPAYALLRDDVRGRRPAAPRSRTGSLNVAVVFGGTDPHRLTAPTVHALVAAAHVHRITVLGDERTVTDTAPELRSAARVHFAGLVPDVAGALAAADLVVGAAGTNVWEFSCLGLPAAVVAAAANQEQSYERLTALGAVVGLGSRADVLADPAGYRERIAAVAADAGTRSRVAARAFDLVDGAGRERVASALLAVVAARQGR